jgi:large repetitive protein
MKNLYFPNPMRSLGLRSLTLTLLLALPVMVKAALSPFTLTVTSTAETCTGNGKQNWTITGQTAGSTMVYAIYKSPNYTTAISTQSSTSLTGLTAGSYRVIATQTLGAESNSQTKDATIANSVIALAYTGAVTPEICGNDGRIVLTVTAGTAVSYEITSGPVTFPPQASNTFSGLAAGTYNVKVTDACGDALVKSFTITKFTPVLNIGTTQFSNSLSCGTLQTNQSLSTTGAGTVNAYPLSVVVTAYTPGTLVPVTLAPQTLGGSVQYDPYVTNSAGITIPFWPNQAYTYDLKITDACGKVYTKTIPVNLNPNLQLQWQPSTCSGVYIKMTGVYMTAPAVFTITSAPAAYTGPTTFTASSFYGVATIGDATNPIAPGTYNIQVVDACGITRTSTITVANTVVMPGVQSSPGCGTGISTSYLYGPGGVHYTSAIVTAAPAAYGAVPRDISSSIYGNGYYVWLENVPAGNYTVQLMDDCGTPRTKTFTATGYNPGTVIANVIQNCSSFDIFLNNTGQNGGQPAYALQKWFPASGKWGNPTTGVLYNEGDNFFIWGGFSSSVQGLNNGILNAGSTQQGTFRIIKQHAYDANPIGISYKYCIETLKEFTVSYSMAIANVTGFHCPGGNSTDVGILATGGIPPLSYQITTKDGAPFVVNNGTNNLFTGLADGTYIFRVTDNCGNILNQVYDITILSSPQITPVSLCPGSNGQLAVNGVPYLNFQWWKEGAPGTILSTTYNLPITNFNPATDAGTYYVHLTSPSGSSCVDRILSFTVSANPSTPNAGADNTVSVCQSTGGINLIDYLSAAADKYGSFTDASGNAVPGNVWYPNQHPAGSYAFTYSVNGQCSGTDQSVITVSTVDKQAPVLTCPANVTVTVNSVGCKATGVVLGTPTVTDNCTATANIVVTNNAPASFPVGNTLVTWTATDASGNSATCQQTVTVAADVVSLAYTSSATTQCGGDTFTATFTPTPSTAQVTWTNSQGESGSGDINQLLTNTTSAPITVSYTVTAASPFGCTTDTKTMNVTVNPTPVITSSACQQTICSGETASISFSTSIPATISWTGSDGTSGSGDISAVKTNTGSAPITITYTINGVTTSGCNAQPRTCQVIVNPVVAAPTASVTVQPTCAVSTGTITVTAPIGAGYTYSVDGTNYQSGTTFSGLATGSYNVTVKNSDGCISAASALTINAQPLTPAAPTASVTAQPTCGVSTGTITVTAPVGAGYTYSVDGTNYQSGTTFSGLVTGSYNVTVKNSDGCISAATTLTINAQPLTPAAPTASVIAQPTCAVSTGTITVTAPIGAGYTYSVDGTNYQSGTTFSGLATGSYNMTVKNSDGCISAATALTINAQPLTPAAPTASVTVQPTCGVSTGTITVTAPIGAGYTYSVDGTNYESGTTFSGLVTGSYNVTVKNSDGCISLSTPLTINTQPATPIVSILAVNPMCANSPSVTIVGSPVGGTFSGTGISPVGLFSPTTAGVGSHIINYSYTNSAGCTAVATTTIDVLSAPALTINPASQTICAGSSASIAVVGNNGGTVTWSSNYFGLTGTGTSFDTGVLTNSGTASYTLNLTATAVAGTCQDKVVASVTVLPEPRIIPIPKLTTICSYENLHVTLSSVIAGTSISWSIIDNTNSQTIASGTGLDNVTITNKLPAGSYSIKATGTKDGCTSGVTNVPVVVN